MSRNRFGSDIAYAYFAMHECIFHYFIRSEKDILCAFALSKLDQRGLKNIYFFNVLNDKSHSVEKITLKIQYQKSIYLRILNQLLILLIYYLNDNSHSVVKITLKI